MGAKRGEPKETVTIRLTPKARLKIKDIKQWRVRQAIYGSGREFTNSLIIEQAINQYYKIVDKELRDPKRCGRCGQKFD
jgi:hypothetical protein